MTALEKVLDTFPFDTCAVYMSKVNWPYSMKGYDRPVVPNADEIKAHAAYLLNELGRDDVFVVRSGGFTARRDGGRLSLEFNNDSVHLHQPTQPFRCYIAAEDDPAPGLVGVPDVPSGGNDTPPVV